MDYQELVHLSTKGDQQALENLFALAEKLSAEKKHEESTKVFRDSAISYRALAFHNSELAESADRKVHWLNEEIKLIKQWIKANPSGLRPLPRIVEGITNEHIFKIVGCEIWPNSNLDGQFCSLISCLESELNKIDGGWYCTAHSELRRILFLMNDYFGPYRPAKPMLLEYRIIMDERCIFRLKSLPLEVRIWADLLADEVERRFHASKTENSSPP